RDAEMTDNRKFQRQDAALWLGLEQILGDDSSVSYNSLEQKNLAYLMNCLNRWLVRWEEELAYKLLSTLEFQNDSHYIKFNSAALLRSDHKTTVESLSLAINSTIMSPNEAREKLDMLPYDGGDTHQNPAITPGGSAMETDTVVVDTGNAAVVARLQHLIGVEARRVEQAASKGRNYVGWVDAFYADNWEPKLANWFEELGIDRDAASTYCRESKRRLLDVCDYSTNDTLASNISKCVSTWKNRANTIGVVANV
ncbi:MAG: phage portal protein, partial [Planctomycetales bacterium]|nr:phage portal protein [Planctomycetales bacterium]